ncbi:hypothetical protein ERJ75_000396400 [Trypanosoma vivax]|nr:hypothetical protein ERJ75_000396400 [Trypanosoma vivax]
MAICVGTTNETGRTRHGAGHSSCICFNGLTVESERDIAWVANTIEADKTLDDITGRLNRRRQAETLKLQLAHVHTQIAAALADNTSEGSDDNKRKQATATTHGKAGKAQCELAGDTNAASANENTGDNTNKVLTLRAARLAASPVTGAWTHEL